MFLPFFEVISFFFRGLVGLSGDDVRRFQYYRGIVSNLKGLGNRKHAFVWCVLGDGIIRVTEFDVNNQAFWYPGTPKVYASVPGTPPSDYFFG